VESYEDYIKRLRKDGYIDENFAPLKCWYCESENVDYCNHLYEEGYVVEYDAVCKDCGKKLGNWAYGVWYI
jgi:hypothetical protein